MSIPAQWTSLSPEDPWVSLSTHQSFFRAPDLLELVNLIKGISRTSEADSDTQKEIRVRVT
jgi:hypothetical protein